MAKATTKKVATKKTTKVEAFAIRSSSDAKKVILAINKALLAIAAEHNLKLTKQGTPLYNAREGKLTLPKLMMTNITPAIAKGTRVETRDNRAGTVTKVEGKIVFVQFDDATKVERVPKNMLTVTFAAPDPKREKVLPTLAQGVRVSPDTEYAVKGGGSAILMEKREGRVKMWVIEVNKGTGKGWVRFGMYGRAAGAESVPNRRFAEQQLRWIVAGKKGAKKTNPSA